MEFALAIQRVAPDVKAIIVKRRVAGLGLWWRRCVGILGRELVCAWVTPLGGDRVSRMASVRGVEDD